MPAAASPRAGITNLLRRLDLAPAVLIIAGIVAPQDAARGYGSVTLAARTTCEACVWFENQAPILIVRQPTANAPFAVLWPQAKHYD